MPKKSQNSKAMLRFRAVVNHVKEMLTIPSAHSLVFNTTKDINLFQFSRVCEADTNDPDKKWLTFDDSMLSGRSKGSFVIVEESASMSNTANISKSNPTKFLRWQGTTDTKVREKDIARSGFCSLRSPEFKLTTDTANALKLTLRSDARNYMINLHVDAWVPGDLYQGYIFPTKKQANKWVTYTLPFKNFLFTSGGRVKDFQDQSLQDFESINRIAFLVADGKDGPFQLDIDRIEGITSQIDQERRVVD